jgi:hypothetical protein
MNKASWQQLDIRLCAVFASLLLSVYTILWPELPNDDAYVYIRTAEIFQQQGLDAALAHYKWAGYSILIAGLSQLGPSLLTAAYLINALFFMLLVYSFVSLVRLIDASRPVLVLAALTILLYPELNEFRFFIIRDVGSWALSLFALLQFILYSHGKGWRHGAAFCISLLLATVFRAEAISYLLLTPLVLLLGSTTDKQLRMQLFGQLAAMVAAALAFVLMVLLALEINVIALMLDFLSVYEPFIRNTLSPSAAETAELGRMLFGEHGAAFSQQYMTGFIAAGLLVIFFMTIFYGLSGPYFWLLLYGVYQKYFRLGKDTAIPMLSYIAINAVILFVFLYITRYLSSRYAILLCLMLILQLPIVLQAVIENSRKGQHQSRIRALLLVLMVYCLIDSYYTMGRPKDYLTDSANYVAVQATPGTALITNNHSIAYFSSLVEDYDQVIRILPAAEIVNARPGDLIALEMIYDVSRLVQDQSLSPYLQLETAFPSMEDQRVVIYRRVNP